MAAKFEILTLYSLANSMENDPAPYMLSAVQVLPMPSSLRDNVSSVIKQYCSKAQNVVFALLIGKLYDSFVRKRALVKYQSQSEVITVMLQFRKFEKSVKFLKIQILKPLNFEKSHF